MTTADRTSRQRLCLALDVRSIGDVRSIVRELADFIGIFKVGLELFTNVGPEAVGAIKSLGGLVFLDLKLHDIPNTVARTTRSIVDMGVSMMTIHASGGSEMMRAAADVIGEESAKVGTAPPRVLAVTVLTSLSEAILNGELSVAVPLREHVVALSKLTQASGLAGVVASPQEIPLIRNACGKSFLIVTPGIRPAGFDPGDQSRVTTAAQAMLLGADYIVVGRPILAAADRVAACQQILAEMPERGE